MNLYYDLHIHSGLSPCGDEDMTPNNIVNMALIKELDCIAVTDHNSCGNVKAVMDAARDTGLLVIPGMEVETAEEVHMLCLFPDINSAFLIWKKVEENLLDIPLKEKIFGRQVFYNENDEETGYYDKLLITATKIDLYTLFRLVRDAGGVAIPAHVDRGSNSILSNLGLIPPDLDINLVEFSRMAEPESYLLKHKKLFPENVRYLCNSDAHYLGDINERKHYLRIDGPAEAWAVIEKLKSF